MKKEVVVWCPYCGRKAKLIYSQEVYGQSYCMMWMCWPCNAYTGCHRASKVHKPLGTLANAPLRKLRQQAHAAFDPMWMKGLRSRTKAYEWMSRRLGITKERCHISMFDEAQCRQLIELLKIPF